MKNTLTDSQIVENKIASLTPAQQAKWKTKPIGLFNEELREEIKSIWIKEKREEEMLGEHKESNLFNLNAFPDLLAQLKRAVTALNAERIRCTPDKATPQVFAWWDDILKQSREAIAKAEGNGDTMADMSDLLTDTAKAEGVK